MNRIGAHVIRALALLLVLTTLPGPAHAWPTSGYALPVKDRGIFPELTGKVRLHYPTWLSGGPALLVQTPGASASLLYVAAHPVGFGRPKMGVPLQIRSLRGNDADGDGIPDTLDLLIGGKKAVLNGAAYTEGYRKISYPNGDLPRSEGVCTDVIIRALRNAGIDLQQRVHLDIKRARKAYPMVRRPDANIDHRRVRTLLPFFKRHFTRLPADPGNGASSLLPGDIVFMNTMGDKRPDHIGIISDRLGPSKKPLVINSWTVGYRTSEMDLLSFVPVTHHFRLPNRPLQAQQEQRGLQGLLRRRGLTLPGGHRQLLLVTAPLWSSSDGTLQRYALDTRHGRWRKIGRQIPVQLGSAGLGLGRGLLGEPPKTLRSGPQKREGDNRSPAGIFAMGTAFGRSPSPYAPGKWPYRRTDPLDRLVDDPQSPLYNTWQRAPADGGKASWRSAEDLFGYQLGLVVQHNTRPPIKPGAGSAIFLHVTMGAATLGCTTMARKHLIQVLRWLRPPDRPLLVQLPGVVL